MTASDVSVGQQIFTAGVGPGYTREMPWHWIDEATVFAIEEGNIVVRTRSGSYMNLERVYATKEHAQLEVVRLIRVMGAKIIDHANTVEEQFASTQKVGAA